MMLRLVSMLFLLLNFLVVGSRFCQALEGEDEVPHAPKEIVYGTPKMLCRLASPSIRESSGIACSRRREGVFWTHNDSGGDPRIYAFNRKGEDLFRCDDGANDFEAVAVDGETRTVFLASKCMLPISKAYSLPIPKRGRKSHVTANTIARVKVFFPTAMDISPDGKQLLLLTYGHALEFTRRTEETWAQALARPPRMITMPARDQGEAVCYGLDGKSLYLTSEGAASPLWELPANEESEEPE